MKAKYISYEGECLAVVWVVSSFRYYIYGNPFTLITNNQPLKFLMELDWLTRKLAMWALILKEYDLDIIHKLGVLIKMPMSWNGTQVPMRRIPLGFVGMVMWIWRWYQSGMLLHTFVPYWGVLGMYIKLVWMMKIPMMWTSSQRVMVLKIFMMMHLSLHICKQKKFQLD